MADITRTKEQVAIVYPGFPNKINNGIAGVAIEAGQPVYVASTGKYGVADANAAAADQFRGIALTTVGAGQPISVLEEGCLYGFTLAGAHDSAVFVSDTAGELADAAGTASLQVGLVWHKFDSAGNVTKILKVTGFAG